jgi:hypothetical protein
MDFLAAGTLPGVILDSMAALDPKLLVGIVTAVLREGKTNGPFAVQVTAHEGVQALVNAGQIDLARTTVDAWARDPAKLDCGSAIYDAVASALGKKDPAEAVAWIRSLPPTDDRTAALTTFAGDWASRDPVAALHWAETLPPQEGQVNAVQRAFSDWVEVNAGAAGEWLGDYLTRAPSGPETDRLIGGIINLSATAKQNPLMAFEWASLISDPAIKQSYEERIVLRWGSRDRLAAIDFIQKSPAIPAERKQMLADRVKTAGSADEYDY